MQLRHSLFLAMALGACSSEADDPPDAGSTPNDSGSGDSGPSDTGLADSGGVGPVTSDPFDPPARAAELAAAICGHREVCEPLYTTYLPETLAQCEAREAGALLASWRAFVRLIDARRAGFAALELERCVQSYRTAMTECDLGPAPGACDAIFTGNRPSPSACGHSIECAPGNWCTAPALSCGICVPKAGIGGNCVGTPCASGSECIEMGAAGSVCVANTAGLAQGCGTPTTGLCRGHLQCVGPAGGALTCVRPAPLGMPCDHTGVAADCDLTSGLACDGANVCSAVTVVGPPAACGDANVTNLCDGSSRCNFGNNQCEPRVALGGVCDDGIPCAPGLRCEPDAAGSPLGHCRAPLATGATCTSPAQCSALETCISGRCGPLLIDASCG